MQKARIKIEVKINNEYRYLGERLETETKEKIKSNVEKRIIDGIIKGIEEELDCDFGMELEEFKNYVETKIE